MQTTKRRVLTFQMNVPLIRRETGSKFLGEMYIDAYRDGQTQRYVGELGELVTKAGSRWRLRLRLAPSIPRRLTRQSERLESAD